MRYLDIEALRATPLRTEPYDYIVVPDFVRPERFRDAIADYPSVPGPGSHPLTELHIADRFQALLDEMNRPEFRTAVEEKFGIDVLVPDDAQRGMVHEVIYDELCLGKISEDSRRKYLETIDALHARGAEAVILGCTEIGLLVKQQHTPVRLYDTATIHAEAAAQMAIS